MLLSYLLLPCLQLSKTFLYKLSLLGYYVLQEMLGAKVNVHTGVTSLRSERCVDVFCLSISKTSCTEWSKTWYLEAPVAQVSHGHCVRTKIHSCLC